MMAACLEGLRAGFRQGAPVIRWAFRTGFLTLRCRLAASVAVAGSLPDFAFAAADALGRAGQPSASRRDLSRDGVMAKAAQICAIVAGVSQ